MCVVIDPRLSLGGRDFTYPFLLEEEREEVMEDKLRHTEYHLVCGGAILNVQEHKTLDIYFMLRIQTIHFPTDKV